MMSQNDPRIGTAEVRIRMNKGVKWADQGKTSHHRRETGTRRHRRATEDSPELTPQNGGQGSSYCLMSPADRAMLQAYRLEPWHLRHSAQPTP
ncbi:hypothetical protein KM043_015668 [Ampulex compressa]|nr:hypothetical protein KM043_015668 [Ampulex compressa]